MVPTLNPAFAETRGAEYPLNPAAKFTAGAANGKGVNAGTPGSGRLASEGLFANGLMVAEPNRLLSGLPAWRRPLGSVALRGELPT